MCMKFWLQTKALSFAKTLCLCLCRHRHKKNAKQRKYHGWDATLTQPVSHICVHMISKTEHEWTNTVKKKSLPICKIFLRYNKEKEINANSSLLRTTMPLRLTVYKLHIWLILCTRFDRHKKKSYLFFVVSWNLRVHEIFFGCIFSISRLSHLPNVTCFDCLLFDYWGNVLAFCHVDKILDRSLYQQKKTVFFFGTRSCFVICSLFCMQKTQTKFTLKYYKHALGWGFL